MPMVVHNSIAGSEIWLKLASEPRAFTSGYGSQTGVPADYFHSDSGLDVELNASGEAALSLKIYLYVNSSSESPAGNDSSGNGSQDAPYASIGKAIEKISSFNNSLMDAIIYVKGDVPCNTIIDDDGTTTNESGVTAGKQLIAQTLKIEGVGSTATAVLNGNTSARVLDSRTTVPLTLKNLTIKNGSSSTYGGGLYIDGTTVEINNCIIENNSAGVQGGGVYLTNGALLTMNGQSSVIRSNWLTEIVTFPATVATTKCGGGVYINSGTTKFVMNAGTIEGNGAYSGGGVYVRGTFEMNGEVDTTVIQSNVRIDIGNTSSNSVLTSTQLTANVEVGIPGTFNMNGGKITSSLSEGQNGAGVCLYASHTNGDENGTATFNMSDGEISGLNISQTAAVYLLAAPNGSSENFSLVFNMSGGKITGNTAIVDTYSEHGTCAGVYVGRYGAFNMTGGEISHNHARINAGGVYRENITGTGLIVPTITLGQTSSASTILIKDNTVGSPAVTGNIYLDEGKTVTVAGALSTASEVGITRAGAFSATPFTSGYGTTNSGTAPADIFTSDEGYSIIAGTGGEAAFLTYSPSGTVYAPSDYHFTLAASKSSVTLGRAANVTVTPDITRTEPNGNTTPLFYKAADHKLYLDSAFTQPEGSNAEVTWSASLWCGTEVEVPSLSAGTGANANKFTIPALSFENTYTLNVTATYQGYTHNANLSLQCQSGVTLPEGFVAVTGATVTGEVSGSSVFITNRTVTIPNLYVCDHEVTQAEFTDIMGTNPSSFNGSSGKEAADGEVQENRPVEYVNWYAAIAYCNKKSISENLTPCYTVSGVSDWATLAYSSIPNSNNSTWNSATCDFTADGYRLPTEAEWEYIARGGDGSIPATQTTYSGGTAVGNVAWYSSNSGDKTHEVKKKTANTLGIYDMSGNVWEWCWDWNGSSITSSTPAAGPSSGSNRVYRGGSWSSDDSYCNVSYRNYYYGPYYRLNYIGFRVVRTAE
jgi:formylglycine-generating enzyme required for sulfatase activity